MWGCGEGAAPEKPELPRSVSPGWTQKTFAHAEALPGLPAGAAKPDCWKAEYGGPGTASVWTCGYKVEGGAFDAAQRFPSSGSQVKFQSGKYLVVVEWTGGSRAEVTALVRAVQKILPMK
jgi:hypothetical protein